MLKVHSTSPRSPAVTLIVIMAAGLATLLGQVSLIAGVPSVWPGLGLAVAALWMAGLHYWPEVAVGIFCGALAAHLPVFPAFVQSVGQTAGALCAVSLLGPLLCVRKELNRIKDVAAFVFLGGVVGASVAATISSAALGGGTSFSFSGFGLDLGHFFMAGVTGVLVIAPPFLYFRQRPGCHRAGPGPGEFWFWHGALLASGIMVFSGLFPYAYLLVPFLIALPLRFGHLGGASGLALTGLTALAGTVKGYGPFADEGATELFPLQIFLAAVSVMVLVFVAVSAEKEEAEEMIRAQAALLDRATDAISVKSLVDGRYRYWNKSAERIYGFTAAEVLGRTDREIPIEKDAGLVSEAESMVRQTGEWSGELPQRGKSSRALIVQSRWSLIKEGPHADLVLIIASEITEKKKLEAEMKLAQRLDCIGTLAAGVAHDLNNVLGPIRNTVRVLRAGMADPSSQRLLAALEVSAGKGIEMVRQVLSFASGSRADKGELQIGYLIRAIVKVCRATFPRNISIHADIPRDLATLLGDPAQIHQMLFNLCLNARDAMPRGGALRISAKDRSIAADALGSFPEARAGPYLQLEVSDMGEGIPPRILHQIFDPFFTTKQAGQGTGLGLYTVARIVKQHKGFVRVKSHLEEGTTFEIYLPALPRKEEQCPSPNSGPVVGSVS